MFDLQVTGQYDLSPARYQTLSFIAGIKENQYVATRYITWLSDTYPSDVLDPERIVSTFRSGTKKRVESVLYEGDDALATIELSSGTIFFTIAGVSNEACDALYEEVRGLFPTVKKEDPRIVPMRFWSYSAQGPKVTRRDISVRTWEEIAHNYTGAASHGLSHLMDAKFRPGHGGQLVLWSGEPGTGKTTALRALATHWREWCTFHYITDPETFFGSHADYMMSVLLEDNSREDHWRVLILEDTGELLQKDAKYVSGQAFARLLNVVDGIIGQGLNVLTLVTTNEPVGKLNPAITRPGRCASRIEFEPLSRNESEEWLVKEGLDPQVAGPMTIADLYARVEGFKKADTEDKKPVGFGA